MLSRVGKDDDVIDVLLHSSPTTFSMTGICIQQSIGVPLALFVVCKNTLSLRFIRCCFSISILEQWNLAAQFPEMFKNQ